MSTATNDDIREAYALIGRWDADDSGTYLDLARVIAAALADERAKARAPFLALAEELDRELADRGVLLDRVVRPGDRIRAVLVADR